MTALAIVKPNIEYLNRWCTKHGTLELLRQLRDEISQLDQDSP